MHFESADGLINKGNSVRQKKCAFDPIARINWSMSAMTVLVFA